MCPTIEAWLLEAQNQDAKRVQVLIAYLRAIVTGATDLQKFLEVIGPGGTGKGTYLRLATALVGWENAHATTLELLEVNRFETASLEGKRLVLITDADHYGGSINTLKALSGGDPLRAERKYAPAFTFAPEALVLVAANEAIQSTDYTSGLERRRITVPFTRRPARERQLIEFHRGQARGEFVLELPGLVNRVLALPEAEMVRLLRRIPQAVPSLQEAWTWALVESNPLAQWANACLILEPGVRTQIGLAKRLSEGYERDVDWLYPNYCAFADGAGIKHLSLTRFPQLLDDLLQHQLRLRGVGYESDGKRAFIRGVRLRGATDTHRPGLIAEAVTAMTAQEADEQPTEGIEAPILGIFGSPGWRETQLCRDFQDFRGLSEKSLIGTEGPPRHPTPYREDNEKPPQPPDVPPEAGSHPAASPATPGGNGAPAPHPPPALPTRWHSDYCRSTRFWRKRHGGWICIMCHPPGSPAEIAGSYEVNGHG
jgi:hypothetical protein